MTTMRENIRLFSQPGKEMGRLKILDFGVETLPVSAWLIAIVAAFLGSMLYGISVAWAAGWPHYLRAGALIVLPAGLGWCVLGAALVYFTRLNPWLLAHACLVTMFWGELRLLAAAGLNTVVAAFFVADPLLVLVINGSFVLGSNLLMMLVLAVQLRELGVPFRKVALWWMFFLNGGGLLGLTLCRRLLPQM